MFRLSVVASKFQVPPPGLAPIADGLRDDSIKLGAVWRDRKTVVAKRQGNAFSAVKERMCLHKGQQS
jgi:hypothetical protein